MSQRLKELERKREEDELKKKLEDRRRKMEEQKNKLAEEETKEKKERAEKLKHKTSADLDKERIKTLEESAKKLELQRQKMLEEEMKKKKEEDQKIEQQKEVLIKEEISALRESSKKVHKIVTAPDMITSPRRYQQQQQKLISDSERQRRIVKVEEEAKKETEKQKIAASANSKSKMLVRAQTLIYKPSGISKKVDDRKMKQVPRPISTVLDESMLFDLKGIPNTEMFKVHFLKEGRVSKSVAHRLIKETKAMFEKYPNIIQVAAPAIIVGDLHGQYYDLISMMKKAGHPMNTQYVFMGDYVDRGMFAMEIVLYLLSCKLAYKNTFHLLRGNHEGRGMTNHFNFRRECVTKYGDDTYDMLMKCFDTLPLCALVDGEYGKFMCMHGGLSPYIHSVEDIVNIDRFTEVPETGPYCDLLWSDPVEEKTFEDWQVYDLNRYRKIDFESNPSRNLSFTYGYKFAKEFCDENNLISIVRAHEVQKDGYFKHWFGKQDRQDPYVITIFSAPNYTDTHGNKAAYLNYNGKSYSIEQYEAESHPYVLPNFENAIVYSLPFVAENSCKVFAQMLAMIGEPEADEEKDQLSQSIAKKIEFMLRTVANYKYERIKKQKEIEETKRLTDAPFEEVMQKDAQNEKAPVEIAVSKVSKNKINPLLQRSTSVSSIKKIF